MSEVNATSEPQWWVQLIQGAPRFSYGFIIGAFSGFCANWAWDKVKNLKKNSHLNLAIDEEGTTFSGRMEHGKQIS